MPALQFLNLPLNGGVDTNQSTLHKPAWAFARLSYWDPFTQGMLRARFGTLNLIANAGSVPSLLQEVKVGSVGAPVRYLIIHTATGGVVKNSSDLATITGTLFTWSTAQVATQVDVLNGSAWFVNGADTPKQWTGASSTTVVSNVPAMPVARVIKMYKNYCFVARTAANPSRVFFSAIKDPTTWPTNNFQDVSPDDGDDVTALHPTTEGLLVFKNRSVWMMLGDTFDAANPQWRLLRLTGPEGVGTVNPQSVRTLPGIGVVWLARDGFYVWTGGEIRRVSDPISGEEARSLDGVIQMETEGTGWDGTDTLKDASATVYRNSYWCSVRSPVSGRYLVRWDGVGRWTIGLATSYFVLTNYNNVLLGGGATGDVRVFALDAQQQPTLSSGTRGFVEGDAYTAVLDLGEPDRLKHLRRVTVVWSVDSSVVSPSLVVDVIPELTAANLVTATFSQTSGIALGTVGGDNLREASMDVNLQARVFQLRYRSSTPSIPAGVTSTVNVSTTIHSVTLEYTAESIHGGSK